MDQRNSQRSGTPGRSRAKGSSRGRAGSARTGSHRTSSGGYHSGRPSPRRNEPDYNWGKIAVGVLLLAAAIACIVFLFKGMKRPSEAEPETEVTTEAETELQKEVTVDGINITGMSREEAREALLKRFSWGMKVTFEGESYDVADMMANKVDALLADIYSGEPKESYALDTAGLEAAVQSEADRAAAMWNVAAKNGSISSYDASTDKFLFTGAETGREIDTQKLAADIGAALGRKDFDAVIEASANVIEPEFSEETAREKYKTVSTFTTKTTANSNRNTNVRLAAEAVNGTVLQVGEEFSFNDFVGERTEAKGYKSAGAYSNGEVVEEIGGGVCQISSTLYNAVLKAGLKTTVRRSHTFEPSYVTPGTDATVSWGGPDYKFVNNSSAAIGIRASYADRTVTVSIYAIPVLEEGVTYSLESKKVKELDPPPPTYEEDGLVVPGMEVVAKQPTMGSYWETRLVIKKDGEVISREIDHTATYKGHAAVIHRNTSGTMAALPENPDETTIDPSGAAPSESETDSRTPGGPASPGGETPGGSGGSGVVSRPGETTEGRPAPTEGTPAPTQSSSAPTEGSRPTPSSAPTEGPAPTQGSAPTAGEPAPAPADDIPVVAPNPGE